MDCPTCSTPVRPDDRFCGSCGARLTPASPHDVTSEVAKDEVATDATSVHAPVDATSVQPAIDVAVAQPAPVQPVSAQPVSAQPVSAQPAPAAAAGADDGASLRACPACGAPNSGARVLCGRCGVELATGQPSVTGPVVQPDGPVSDVTGEVDTEHRTAGRTALTVAAIVLVGAVVGVLVGVWVVGGSGSGTPDAEPAMFDPTAYPDEPVELTITAVGASSTRPAAGDVDYGHANLVDGDLTTAWSHNPAEEEVTDVDLAFVVAEPAWVTSLTFGNGAQSDDLAFAADGRVARLALVVDGEAAVELQLLDQPGLQQVTLPEPLLLDEVRLVVLEAVPGTTYPEVSLSEVGIIGHVATGDDLTRMLSGG